MNLAWIRSKTSTIRRLSIIETLRADVGDKRVQHTISFRCEPIGKEAYVFKGSQVARQSLLGLNQRRRQQPPAQGWLGTSIPARQSCETSGGAYLHSRVRARLAESRLVATSSLGPIFARSAQASKPSPTFDPVTMNVPELTVSADESGGGGGLTRCSQKNRRRLKPAGMVEIGEKRTINWTFSGVRARKQFRGNDFNFPESAGIMGRRVEAI